jgi:predicted DNA-binding protein
MQTKSILVRLPASLKKKLDAMREEGVTASGLIRHLLEQHFKGKKAA